MGIHTTNQCDSTINKESLRSLCLKKRAAFSPQQIHSKSQAICHQLLRLIEQQNFNQVFLYAPMPHEVDVFLILPMLHSDIAVALPKMRPQREMDFCRWARDSADLATNKMGIRQPQGGQVLPATSQTLIVVPALAMTKSGDRLGYGGGYYDRYLAMAPSQEATKVAVVFAEFLFSDHKFPSDPWDQKIPRIFCA